MTTGMLTDRYELTMAASWIAEGMHETPAVFEAFARRLPKGRQYGVVAGTERLIELVTEFRFKERQVEWLMRAGAITPQCAEWLATFRFRGDIVGYREGELYFPGSPILTVSGGLAECALIETLVLSVLNHDSAVASAGARMVDAAGGRSLIDMGSRRTHEQAAVHAARAAYLVGFDATSNLEAGWRYGVPTTGTAAHAFTLSHRAEPDAFAAQIEALGPGTTLLVDTYDIERGIATAVEVAGAGLGGIRIDSGDPAVTSRAARAQLDALGATGTRIVITGDADEYVIAALSDAPVDAFGVGTRLATGSGHPTAGMVYKLVAIGDREKPHMPMRSVAKAAAGKASIGGRKVAYRELDSAGHAVAERIAVRQLDDPAEAFTGRRLQIPLMRGGKIAHDMTLADSRRFHARVREELPLMARGVADGSPFLNAQI
jgi:nicotinate phosphoribosyltransferase